MANEEHLARLRDGVDAWNAWRKKYRDISPDLRGADLRGKGLSIMGLCKTDLQGADLRKADLQGVNLQGANLDEADLCGANLLLASLEETRLFKAKLRLANLHMARLSSANLRKMDLRGADLSGANLSGADLYKVDLGGVHFVGANLTAADLRKAKLTGANLEGANLTGAKLYKAELSWTNLNSAIFTKADLSGATLERAILSNAHLREADFTRAQLNMANLRSAILIQTTLLNADLTGCRIYGISAWDLKLQGAIQRDLVITKPDEPEITVDNLEVAQFIYLLLHNEKIRNVIDTITSKVVLILGRFMPERKTVLDALREDLRKRDYLPVLFDFEKPKNRTTDETITLLARMARFVIADITDAKSVLQELRGIVPETPSLVVQPIIIATQEKPGMFDFYSGTSRVFPTYYYTAPKQLIGDIRERVIGPAEAKVRELRGS